MREDKKLAGTIFNPQSGNYIALQIHDSGLEKVLPMDGKVDTMAVSNNNKKHYRE